MSTFFRRQLLFREYPVPGSDSESQDSGKHARRSLDTRDLQAQPRTACGAESGIFCILSVTMN